MLEITGKYIVNPTHAYAVGTRSFPFLLLKGPGYEASTG